MGGKGNDCTETFLSSPWCGRIPAAAAPGAGNSGEMAGIWIIPSAPWKGPGQEEVGAEGQWENLLESPGEGR